MRPSDYIQRSLVDTLPHGKKSLGSHGAGGLTEREMKAAHRVVLDAMPLTVRCVCGYRYTGATGRALELMAAHRLRRHPELASVKGKRARERARAEVLAMRRKTDAAKRTGEPGPPSGSEAHPVADVSARPPGSPAETQAA